MLTQLGLNDYYFYVIEIITIEIAKITIEIQAVDIYKIG